MKNAIILLSLLLLFSCKKKDNTTPANILQSTADSLGFLFEHTYHIADNSNPGYDTLYHSNNIIFHTDGTIREFSNKFDTTYSAAYIVSRNNVTSIYQNGIAIKVVVPKINHGVYQVFLSFAEFAQSNNDTITIGNYEAGFMLYDNKATLGCLHGNTSSGIFLWLN